MHILKSFFKTLFISLNANFQQGKGKRDGQAVFHKHINVGFSSFNSLVLKLNCFWKKKTLKRQLSFVNGN